MSIPDLQEPEEFQKYVDHGEPYLVDLEKRSREDDVPIIGPHIGNLLFLLTRMTRAERILELGTANGYSTIWIAKAMKENLEGDDPGSRIVTVEWDEAMAEEAKRNIGMAGFSGLVEQRQGDAREIVNELEEGSFDLIFIDIEKEYYSELLDRSVDLLKKGGLLVWDNTAFTTAGDFLERSTGHPELDTVHFYGYMPFHGPDWDAVTLAVKM